MGKVSFISVSHVLLVGPSRGTQSDRLPSFLVINESVLVDHKFDAGACND